MSEYGPEENAARIASRGSKPLQMRHTVHRKIRLAAQICLFEDSKACCDLFSYLEVRADGDLRS